MERGQGKVRTPPRTPDWRRSSPAVRRSRLASGRGTPRASASSRGVRASRSPAERSPKAASSVRSAGASPGSRRSGRRPTPGPVSIPAPRSPQGLCQKKKKKKNIERGLLRSSTEGNSILQFGAGVMIISVQKMFVWLQARTIDPDVVRTQRDLNPWPSGLESDALPLSYAFPGNKSGGIPLIDSSPSQTPLSASGGALIQYILSILRPPAIRKVQAYSTQ